MTVLVAENLTLPGRLGSSNLTLAGGVFTCLIGPNGSGKTSLLHAIAGIGKPRGRVRIDDVDPWAMPPGQRSTFLAYLPASRELAWPLAARDVLTLGYPDAIDENRLAGLLSFLDLDRLADRRVDRLSTGERSRLLIARALAGDPKLLLLDEPTANLDPLWQLRLMEHLRARTRERGCVLLLALHDLELARRYADRLIIMSRGEVRADGMTEELIAGPQIPDIFGVQRGIQGWEPVSPMEGPQSSP
jgi:iron complex transport system ATP-binding protein